MPGLSRSGTTITAGIATGLDRRFAVKFSFLISIPAVLGANLIELIHAVKDGVDWSLLPKYLLGMAVAMVTGYFALRLLRYIANKGKFGWFAYYCWAVGALAILLSILL
jgi:undecaprenyl-diphosphatase